MYPIFDPYLGTIRGADESSNGGGGSGVSIKTYPFAVVAGQESVEILNSELNINGAMLLNFYLVTDAGNELIGLSVTALSDRIRIDTTAMPPGNYLICATGADA